MEHKNRVIFLTGPVPQSRGQPELLFYEILHLEDHMVDSLAFHHIILVLSSGGRGEVKKSPCIVNGPMIIQDFCNLTN